MLQFQLHLFLRIFGEMTPWAVHYDVNYHFSIFEDLKGWQPCECVLTSYFKPLKL